MTAEQFERVFSKAQDIQTKRFKKEEIKKIEKAMMGFEVEGAEKKATVEQAAYIINLMCMDLTGEYDTAVLMQLRECYLNNVTIVRVNSSTNKKKKKKK